MKKIKWIALILLVLIIVAIGVVWLNLNGIVRSTVETQASQSLAVKTTLGAANVSIFGGSVGLHDLSVGSPKGFSAPQMFTLGGVDVNVALGQLRKEPVHVTSIVIDKPKLVVEQSGGKFNFKALMDNVPVAEPTSGDDNKAPAKPIKLIIDKLDVNNTDVVIRPGIPGVPDEITIPVPSLSLANIGNGDGNQNGAAIKDVVGQVVTALVQKASDSDKLPPQLRQLMKLDVNAVAAQLGGEFNKQLGTITGDLSKTLSGAATNPAALQDLGKDTGKDLKDAGKNLEGGLKGVFGGGDKKKDDKKK